MTAATNATPAPLVPVPLRQELVGRLRNITKLKHWQMAVAEAVKNSMDAIADSKRSGAITVEVERVKDLASSGDGSKPVKTIVVRDNGVGFNNENYISFCTPDSLQKLKQGGKGLGRLTCLQAFHRIRVHSVFKNSDGWMERSLVLQCETPDLLIALDRPGAFASEPFSKSRGYERMVLVEFKRALTDLATVPTDDLPHQQMIRYARQIVDEKALHLGSLRPIKVAADARFYMYAVCELSDALLKRLVEGGFTPSPTGDGAFWVTNQGRYCIEYFSLPKLLEDAEARNLAFFRRLGLEA